MSGSWSTPYAPWDQRYGYNINNSYPVYYNQPPAVEPAYYGGGVVQSVDSDPPELAIAVMGATGSGKSTFINLASGSAFRVGDGLRSCTSKVVATDAFNLDGRRVVLIDTPGFDDTQLSDTQVLRMIALFLEASYEGGCKLAGLLYFHRISDFRVGGTSVRNVRMFRELCGDNAFKNVIVVTNMWGQVGHQVAEAREAELIRDGLFFKHAFDNGAQIARHMGTLPSAQAILRRVLNNHPPVPLQIQVELVDQRRNITQTSAAGELNRGLNAQILKYQEEIRALRGEVERAIMQRDEQLRRGLEANWEETRRAIAQTETAIWQLGPKYEEGKEGLKSILGQQGWKRKFSWAFFRRGSSKAR